MAPRGRGQLGEAIDRRDQGVGQRSVGRPRRVADGQGVGVRVREDDVAAVCSPAGRLFERVFLQVSEQAQPLRHPPEFFVLFVLHAQHVLLGDGGRSVSECDGTVGDGKLRPCDWGRRYDNDHGHEQHTWPDTHAAARRLLTAFSLSHTASSTTSAHGCRQVRSASPSPARIAWLACAPSRHVTSCIFSVAASLSRSRLLRARSCSSACERS
jgi:hypothetical protein